MARYGLIGKNIDHSFSKKFFTQIFDNDKSNDVYDNYDINSIDDLKSILSQHADLRGLNVTIPYKEEIIPFLHSVDKEALKIGAVNTIKIQSNGRLIGYNTDHYGFAYALSNFLPIHGKTALILGAGGAAKAILYVLTSMDFNYLQVSRSKTENNICYEELDQNIIQEHTLIINCTPLGTYPEIDRYPNIPYKYLNEKHLLFDLIYNPTETEFLKRGFAQGATVTNGIKMLEYQAKKSLSIWKS